MVEQVLKWLRQFPGLETLAAENLGTAPGSCALCFQGSRILKRQADLLGNEIAQHRIACLLRLRAVPGVQTAVFFEQLQAWVQQCSVTGKMPTFGENTWADTKDPRLTDRDQTGTAVYEMPIEVHYTKIWNGE